MLLPGTTSEMVYVDVVARTGVPELSAYHEKLPPACLGVQVTT